MDYENGDRDRKYSRERKHSAYDDEKDDDDDYYYKMKRKYKEKEHDYREKDKDYKYKVRRDKEYRDRDRKERTREKEHHRDRDKEKSYKHRDKRHRSKNRSVSPSFHKRDRSSRSRSHSRYHSKSRSRSRSRQRSGSRNRSRSRALPPLSNSSSGKHKHYDDKRYDSFHGRSRGDNSDPPFSHNKGQRKMAILEKLGIDLVVPGNIEKSQTGNVQGTGDTGQKSVTVTGELAAYCNITPANSKMIMDRLNRKKLLWTNKANEQKTTSTEDKEGAANAAGKSTAVWQSAIFTKDGDSKQTAKFKRLMGIKEDEASESKSDTSTSLDNKDLIKRQEEMFQNMEMQYEVARASTHTHRGIGLGFGIHQYPR